MGWVMVLGGFFLVGGVVAGAAEPSWVRLRLVAEGFVSPTALATLDGKTGLMALADQVGRVWGVERDGSVRGDAILDLRSRMVAVKEGFDERGLLGLAVHPAFASNHRFYVFYNAPKRASAPADWDCVSRVSEFRMKQGSVVEADPASERVLLEIDKPYYNHNGGSLAFGADGFLYISTGDGGNGNGRGRGHSPISNGQDLTTLLGKVLRIDVDHGTPYGIPSDNPYAKGGGRPEIFAYGFRNPWRMSFDRGGDHELFVGDIGQDLYEEVDLVVKGGNYGWFVREGRHCFNPDNPKEAPDTCPDRGADGRPFVDPILEYKNPNRFMKDPDAGGISVMGGYVYRGRAIPALQGQYVFGDWSKSWGVPKGLFFRATRAAGAWTRHELGAEFEDGGEFKAYITGFGEDADGELYVFTNASNGVVGRTGKLCRLVGVR